jgi:uncharacterized protein YdeI (YjbR/CyaY-like superfamily)
VKVGTTFYAPNRAAWRRWLARHHRTTSEIWLVYYKKGSGKPRIPYNHAVEEALCFGWIDSIVKTVDARRFAQRFSPRKPGSVLSAMNRERVRRLIAAKKMTRAGLAAIAHAYDHKRERAPRRFVVPADIRRRLQRDPDAWRHFQKLPESYKRIRIGWITAARRRRTAFEQRLRYFLKMTAAGKRFGMVQ